MRHESRSWDPAADPSAPERGFNPPRTHRLWRDRILPRLVVPAFCLAWVALLPARLFRRPRDRQATRLAIESGRIGWTHVFFEELLASAREYLGGAEVEQVVIDREQPYLPQFRTFAHATECTHVLIDVRTGPQDWWGGLRAAMAVAWWTIRHGVTPVVVLADASLRRHRLQAAILTAVDGVVVTFMSVRLVAPMFPHRRIIGPLPMPVSGDRLDRLEAVRQEAGPGAGSVAFIGSVYPPRAQFLDLLTDLLAKRGISLRVNADKYGTSNEDYWTVLATSDVIVTTTLQGMPRDALDWIWIQQMVFRYSEALSAGAVLVAPDVEGVDAWFRAGRDFVPFVSVQDAADAIAGLLGDPGLRDAIRASGHTAACDLVRTHAFWTAIDARLGARALAAG